jgi:hypothetical protein
MLRKETHLQRRLSETEQHIPVVKALPLPFDSWLAH